MLEKVRGLDADLVFPSPNMKGGAKPQSDMTFASLLRRMEREGFTVHGFRSSFRDWASESAHADREVAEAALSHVSGNEVERAYARSDLFERRRKLMEQWATICCGTWRDRRPFGAGGRMTGRTMERQRIERAIDEAKTAFHLGGALSDEPRTGADRVLLREVGHALENLYGPEIQAVRLISEALTKGELVARTPDGTPIPRFSWPADASDPDGSWGNWYWSTISRNACDGFDGCLPMLERAAVLAWLETLGQEASSPRGGRPSKQADAREAYDRIYPDGHGATGDGWKEVSRRVGAVAINTSAGA